MEVNDKKIIDLGDLIRISNDSGETKKIYFVKMNIQDMVKRINNTSHELRPFVALEKINNNWLKGFYTTSNLKGLDFSEDCFTKYRTVLSNKKYRLNKSSIVLIDKLTTIDNGNILREIDSIDNDDLVKIIKLRNLYLRNLLYLKGKYLNEGDVILKNNKNYLIYQSDSSFVYGFRILNNGKVSNSRVDLRSTCNYFISEEDIYKIDFNDSKMFSKNDKYLLCDNVTDDILNLIQENRKRKKYYEKRKRKSKK